jgi:hypothetical protein
VLAIVWVRSSLPVFVLSTTALGCLEVGSTKLPPATVVTEPEPETKPERETKPELESEPLPIELELIAFRKGPIDLLTTDDELFVHIETELLHVDDRGRPIFAVGVRDPAWSWPPLMKQRYSDNIRREHVLGFGGPADRPIISLAMYMARFDDAYVVHRLGGSSAEQLEIKYKTLVGYHTQITNWGDRVVGLPGWEPDDDYFEQFYEDHIPTSKQLKAWAAVDRSLLAAPSGIVSISQPTTGPLPDLLGLIPMVLASDAEGNLHAIAHTLAPDFDPVAVMEEEDPSTFAFMPRVNVGLLGGPVEQHSIHEYVHLRWRPGETKPERRPLPGLEQARVQDVYLSASSAMTLAVRTSESEWGKSKIWLGVLDGDQWRNPPREGLPADEDSWVEGSPNLTIDAQGQAWTRAERGLWRLPKAAAAWIYQPLPAPPIAPSDLDDSDTARTKVRLLEIDELDGWSLQTLELVWARGHLWLVTSAGSERGELLFRVVGADAARRDTTRLTPIELPSSREIYRMITGEDREPEPWDDLE